MELVSLRPNSFIFIGYLKTGDGVRVNPLWMRDSNPFRKILLVSQSSDGLGETIQTIFGNYRAVTRKCEEKKWQRPVEGLLLLF